MASFKPIEFTNNSGNPLSAENLNKLQTNLAEYILDMSHPVGSLYWSSDSTDPGELFGGTWEQIKDVFILAAGDNYEAGETGGEAEHVLTINEMAEHDHTFTGTASSHSHTYYCPSSNLSTCALQSGGGVVGTSDPATVSTGSTSITPKGTISSTGGGEAHNNMPPYLVKYCWERTA